MEIWVPEKTCIKFATYLAKKEKKTFFVCVLMLMGLSLNSYQIAPLEGAVVALSFFNFDAEFALNMMQICPKMHFLHL